MGMPTLRIGRGAAVELDAAGIIDPTLRADYAHCRELAAEHGRTYFLATRLLPAARRPAVHALYGFARTADDIVDDFSPSATVADKTQALQALSSSMRAPDPNSDPSVRAVLHTAERYGLAPELFEDFLQSMRMDLTVTQYETFADLERYVHGSAAVIGLMVTPVLGTVVPHEEAAPFAADLGVAFQLTNFIRDVGEDLRLGRIYLPQDVMRSFGVDRDLLHRGEVTDAVRNWLAFETARTRGVYRRAEPGIAMLEPRAGACVRVAFQLYGEILNAVEQADFAVFGPRIRVSRSRRAQVAATRAAAHAAGTAWGRLHSRRPNPARPDPLPQKHSGARA